MLRRTAGTLTLLALVVLTMSCRPLEQRGGAQVPGGIPAEQVSNGLALPADWGNLISVTTSDRYPDAMQLWLQDSTGNVRVAAYSLTQNKLTYVRLIRRQGQ
jgi:hypothetical protein